MAVEVDRWVVRISNNVEEAIESVDVLWNVLI